jgi:flagellar assembly protein FliH
MSWSRIYKRDECQNSQLLHFSDFSEGGGCMVAAESLFRGDAAPKAVKSEEASSPLPMDAVDVESKIEEAYARGKREGSEKAEKCFGETAQAFSAALEDISRLRGSILRNSTDDMLRLVMAIAEQVISCTVELNPEIIHHTIVKALQAAVDSDVYHIKVHPDDMVVVMEKKPLLLAGISGLKNITVEASPEVTRGGCLVESDLGEVDATIESQLEEIRRKILTAAGGV